MIIVKCKFSEPLYLSVDEKHFHLKILNNNSYL